MRPVSFQITQGEEALTSHSGLALIGALMGRTRLAARVDEIILPERPHPEVSHGDVMTSMIGLLALGKPDFEAVEGFRADPFFCQALGLEAVPSAATLRQRLDGLAGPVEAAIREESADMVARHAPPITPCYEVADGRCGPWIALDIDVSVFDNSHTKKQGVSWTYKKVDGFAPIFAYLGQEGYLINCQLRQGSQHSQQGAPDFLRETLRLARRITGEKLLVRMDSAHDDIATVRQLRRTPKTDFIVKRNLRHESKQTWLEEAQALGQRTCPRPGKELFTGALVAERQDDLRTGRFRGRAAHDQRRGSGAADPRPRGADLVDEPGSAARGRDPALPRARHLRAIPLRAENGHGPRTPAVGQVRHQRPGVAAGHDGLQHPAPVRPDQPARGAPPAPRKARDFS